IHELRTFSYNVHLIQIFFTGGRVEIRRRPRSAERNSYPTSPLCDNATSPLFIQKYAFTKLNGPLDNMEQKSPLPLVSRNALDERQYATIIEELRVISSRVKKEEMMHAQRADWMFAAMVIDRVCFVTFSVFLILCTLVLSYRAPHIFA
ncbi:unnamed protein product, partial [Strongylus vulgaris]